VISAVSSSQALTTKTMETIRARISSVNRPQYLVSTETSATAATVSQIPSQIPVQA